MKGEWAFPETTWGGSWRWYSSLCHWNQVFLGHISLKKNGLSSVVFLCKTVNFPGCSYSSLVECLQKYTRATRNFPWVSTVVIAQLDFSKGTSKTAVIKWLLFYICIQCHVSAASSLTENLVTGGTWHRFLHATKCRQIISCVKLGVRQVSKWGVANALTKNTYWSWRKRKNIGRVSLRVPDQDNHFSLKVLHDISWLFRLSFDRKHLKPSRN